MVSHKEQITVNCSVSREIEWDIDWYEENSVVKERSLSLMKVKNE